MTAADGQAVRLEYYEGHDALSLRFDIRSPNLQGMSLPNFMDQDPQAYDPVEFLKTAFGMPEDFTKPLMDEIHRKD